MVDMMSGSDNTAQLGYTMFAAYCRHLDAATRARIAQLVKSSGSSWLNRLSDESLLIEASRPIKEGWSGISHCVLERQMDSDVTAVCEAAAAFLPSSRISTASGPLLPSDPSSPVVTTVTAVCAPQADLYGVKQEVTLQIVRILLTRS